MQLGEGKGLAPGHTAAPSPLRTLGLEGMYGHFSGFPGWKPQSPVTTSAFRELYMGRRRLRKEPVLWQLSAVVEILRHPLVCETVDGSEGRLTVTENAAPDPACSFSLSSKDDICVYYLWALSRSAVLQTCRHANPNLICPLYIE